MGLDSYLRRTLYISAFDGGDEKIAEIAEVAGVPYDVELSGRTGLALEVPWLYWRKDWAFHEWFMSKVVEEGDNEAEFGVDTIQEFHDDLYAALTYPDTADQLFDAPNWGDPEVDEYRFDDRNQTLKALKAELARIKAIEDSGKKIHPTYKYYGSW